MFDRESLKWLVDEFRSMQRDLTIWEMRQQLDALNGRNNELLVELNRTADLSERLNADLCAISELRREIDSQANYIAELESQVKDTESKRGVLEVEGETQDHG